MQKTSMRLLFLALTIIWSGVIFYLSGRSSLPTPSLFPGQDKLFHLLAFSMLAVFAMGAMKPTMSGYRISQAWLTVGLVALYGLLDEFHQYYVPGRNVELYDFLADAAGGLLGAWGMYYLIKIVVNRKPSAPPAQ
jgi:VanZ family protein